MSAALSAINGALDALSPELVARSGKVFYSGSETFSSLSPIYFLGLNPGGDPDKQRDETIAQSIDRFRFSEVPWSCYSDDQWVGKDPGKGGHQPQVLHLFSALNLNAHQVPSSNLIFVRTGSQQGLGREIGSLAKQCWGVHEAVFRALQISTVVCFGGAAGRAVRTRLGALPEPFDCFVETNERRWKSEAHRAADGKVIVTLTHPSRADWRNPQADPTPFLKRVIERRLNDGVTACPQ